MRKPLYRVCNFWWVSAIYVVEYCRVMQSVAECFSVLQSVAVFCSVLQCVTFSFRLVIAMPSRQVGLVILCVKLLKLPAQSLIDSPGALTVYNI